MADSKTKDRNRMNDDLKGGIGNETPDEMDNPNMPRQGEADKHQDPRQNSPRDERKDQKREIK